MKIINLQKHLFFDSMLDVPGLVAKMMLSWQQFGRIDVRTKEGQSFAECGLYDILDSMCEVANISKDKITLTSNNWTEQHDHYKVMKAPFSYELMQFARDNVKTFDYSGEKFYGMFLGRPNEPRIKAIVQSRRRFIPALTSFNGDMTLPYVEKIVQRLLARGILDRHEIDKATVRHGPLDGLQDPPIIPPMNCYGPQWTSAYSKIALEIVCETTDWPGSFHITEKILRPIYHKRPFITVGARGFNEQMRRLGFKTFQGVIPNYYENFDYCVDQAFECMDKTFAIYGNDPRQLLKDCHEDIEHNYSLLIRLAKDHALIHDKIGGLEYFGQ